jgi:copper chaperone CopZ
MTCSHCVESVRRALLESQGVQSAEVGLSTGEAHVSGTKLDARELKAAVTCLGYGVETTPDRGSTAMKETHSHDE